MKKFTLSTFKSLIKQGVLYGIEKTSFSGMTDGIERVENQKFLKINEIPSSIKICKGRNSFSVIDDDHFEVYNCCGLWSFVILN